ncbi:MAG: hypothetical protein WD738_01835 [Pirellulales bacterium]
METTHRSPITDSPWFWVLIFAGMALAALLAIGPKYGGRQARLELQYQARERIAAERAAGNIDAKTERTNDQAERRDFASPDDTLIPLWPLALILSVVVIFSAIMLIRGRRRPGALVDEGPG